MGAGDSLAVEAVEVVAVVGNNTIVLGGGCFWCLDATFSQLTGVTKVTCGYSGGLAKNPTYEQVCTGQTNYAEVIEITFEPAQIGLGKILEIFWATHNPTTPNQQGADIGSQYRSIVFYKDKSENNIIQHALKLAQKQWDSPIVTEIKPLTKFYPAESYHQKYFESNPDKAYCQIVINPKLSKFRKKFTDYIKSEYK